MSRQVRLDDDVADALETAATRAGHSLSQAANVWLRRGLGMNATGWSAGAERVKATVGGGASSGRCKHPANRRIGDRCAACGDPLPVRR